jgi:hypothetical protein
MTTTTSIVVNGSLVPVNNQLSFTKTPLLLNAVFTSGVFANDNIGSIAVRVESDQSGSLVFQASDDGTTWDTVSTTAVTGGTVAEVTLAPYGGVMRFVYTNGGVNQTAFRLSAYSTAVRADV